MHKEVPKKLLMHTLIKYFLKNLGFDTLCLYLSD